MSSPSRQLGFTLIEILVVVMIVAIISSVSLMSMNLIDDSRELQTERQRLASLIQLAQDEAVMQGRDLGLELMASTYRFVEFDPYARQWNEIPGDEIFRTRKLPDGMEFELYIEDKRIVLNTDPQEFDDSERTDMSSTEESYTPHVFIFSSGELTPYEIHLSRPLNDQQLAIRGDLFGEIEFLNESEN